jgi:hypothetical protein
MLTLSTQPLCAGVPSPYTPVKSKPTEFACLGRSAKLGRLLLPEQIVAAGKPVLAGPVRLVSEPDVLGGVAGKGKVTKNTGDLARWEWTGETPQLSIRSTMTGECDGLMWYKIVLTPKKPLKLSSLRLTIPRIADTARYLHRANFAWPGYSRGLKEIGGSWHEGFMPYVWLGDEQRGLAWCAESDQGWMLNEPTNALKMDTEAGVVRLEVTILDHEETIDSPITLRFGLQASPVKPVSFEWRAKARILHGITYDACKPDKDGHILLDELRDSGVKTVVYHQMWTDYYGKVSTPYGDDLRRLIAECHKRGMKLIVYIGYGLARTAPEMQGHHDEWSTLPLIPWTPSYDVERQSFDATCARSGWADWLVKGIDKLFTDYELDGLYFDGTSEAMRCQNEAHGCGWKDSNGKLHETYAVLAVRSLMRRIADVVHSHRSDAILDVHMSSSLTLPTLSFCDSYWDGEQFEHFTTKDHFELPLDAFRTEFMGYAHGLDAEFLCYEGQPFALDEAIALAWLHGVEVRPNPGTLKHVAPIWHAMDKFGITSAKWLPYWSGSGAVAEDSSTQASSYLKDGKALLFVSHLKREPVTTSLRLDRKALKLGSGKLRAKDAITGAAIDVADDRVSLSFDGMTYKLVEIEPASN